MATLNNRDDERKKLIFDSELYPHADAVYNFALRLTGDASRADDLAQETYLKAWRFIDSYQEGTNARAWLYRICKNAFINEFRAKTREPQPVDITQLAPGKSAATDKGELTSQVVEGQIGDELLSAINSLNPDNRVVVLLDYEEFSYKEIATILDIPLNTVRTRLYRARQTMSDMLTDYALARGIKVRNTRKKKILIDD